jgi:hypothetical protein
MYEAPVHDKKYCTETAPLVSDKQRIFTTVTAVFLIKKTFEGPGIMHM